MSRSAPAALLVALLLAGCLEEPRPAPGAGEGLDTVPLLETPSLEPPVPLTLDVPPPTSPVLPVDDAPPPVTPALVTPPAPEPTGPTVLLRDGKRAHDPDRAPFDVPAGLRALRVEVTANTSFEGSVEILGPDLTVRSRHGFQAGARHLDDPEPGRWWVAYPPGAHGEVFVLVRGVLDAESRPAPVPAPPDTRVPVYQRTFDYASPPGNRTDTFVVPNGTRGLSSYVYHDPPPTTRVNTPTVRLWDPAGTLHQGCAGGPCDETVTDPVPGIWRVSYDGAGTNRVDVAVVLSDALPRVWLQNPWRPVYAAVHGGSSAADRVVLPEGTYGLLFEVYAADASQPVPHVRLLDPAGQEAASCASRYCRVHPGGAAPGGWGVVSEGDGRIEVRLWVMVRQAA